MTPRQRLTAIGALKRIANLIIDMGFSKVAEDFLTTPARREAIIGMVGGHVAVRLGWNRAKYWAESATAILEAAGAMDYVIDS